MYKIFINNIPVYITPKHGKQHIENNANDDDILITDDTGHKAILSIIDQLNSAPALEGVYLLSKNPKGLLKKIRSFYSLVEAAGGLVLNGEGEFLMIFRRGKWDLPKGKVEPGENKRTTAIREVKEETGISKLRIVQSIKLYPARQSATYHTYVQNNIAYIKATHWYLMRTTFEGELKPQAEEDIVQAEWVSRNDLDDKLNNTYASIKDVIDSALVLI